MEEKVDKFISGLQMITEDHIKLMRPDKIEELISKAAHIMVGLSVELDRIKAKMVQGRDSGR